MCSLRDVVIFLAGAEFFHTLSHIVVRMYVSLPLHTSIVDLTSAMNNGAIAVNGIVTILLLIWAARLKKKAS